MFNDTELRFINQKIEIIESPKYSSKKRKIAENKLKNFLKTKESENKNL
jgi:hypothetical protein